MPAHIGIVAVDVERIIDLRHRILRDGLPIETARFPGDEHGRAIHLAAIADGQVIGCATLHLNSFQGQPAYQLRGMAVESAWQRSGVGRRLLAEAEHRASLAGIEMLWANCRTPAVPFYEKNGWQITGDEFIVETAGPHFRMFKVRRA
jgi:GNAT superfamily N-acetyltransferase